MSRTSAANVETDSSTGEWWEIRPLAGEGISSPMFTVAVPVGFSLPQNQEEVLTGARQCLRIAGKRSRGVIRRGVPLA